MQGKKLGSKKTEDRMANPNTKSKNGMRLAGPSLYQNRLDGLGDRRRGRRRGHRGSLRAHLGRRGRNRIERLLRGSLAVGAVPRDVAGLRALVADLAGGAQRAAIGRRAVAGNVSQLAAGVALHGLGLAVTGKVVGAAALVAGRSARIAAVSTTEAATEASATTTTPNASTLGSGAVALDD